jgi:hypothetical protein
MKKENVNVRVVWFSVHYWVKNSLFNGKERIVVWSIKRLEGIMEILDRISCFIEGKSKIKNPKKHYYPFFLPI